jgi:COP9 signalosome complex subunit 6
MLSRRISLLRTYLASLPPSYLSDPSLPPTATPTDKNPLPINHSILRSISATLSRINILAPPDTPAFTLESQQESSDVQLIALLSAITNSASTAKEYGRKSYIVDHGRSSGKRPGGFGMNFGGGSGYGGGGDGQYLDTIMNTGGSIGGGRGFGLDRW